MSGGSLNYVYRHVFSAAEDIELDAETPLHLAFAAHLRKVSQALHDLEWVWSYDYGPGDEVAAIRAVLGEAQDVAAYRERCAKLQTVAVQVLRDMRAQGVLIEWQTLLDEALRA